LARLSLMPKEKRGNGAPPNCLGAPTPSPVTLAGLFPPRRESMGAKIIVISMPSCRSVHICVAIRRRSARKLYELLWIAVKSSGGRNGRATISG
jgi:hypothetical protein